MEESRYVTSADKEEYRKIAESERKRVYVTSKLRVMSYDKKKDSWHELKQTIYNDSLRVSVLHINRQVYRLIWQAFYGKIPQGCKVVMVGEPKIENLKLQRLVDVAIRGNFKKCKVGDTVYKSLKECGEAFGYSESHVQAMASGVRTNVIGVEYV